MSKPALDKPNRRTIEALLRGLCHHRDQDDPLYRKWQDASNKADDFKAKLLNNKRLKKLELVEEAAYQRYFGKMYKTEERAKELLKHYQANGITPYLKAELNKLIKQQ